MAEAVEVLVSYGREIEDTVSDVQKRGIGFKQHGETFVQETKSNMPPSAELITVISTLDEVKVSSPKPVVEVFAWGAVLVAASSLSAIFGAYIACTIVSLFARPLGCALIVFVLLPIYGFYTATMGSNDVTIRYNLLNAALVQGLFLGNIFADTYLTGTPIGFITPLSIAFAFPLIIKQNSDRRALLGTAVGVSFGAHLIVGVVLGIVNTCYLIIALLYSIGNAVVLQLTLHAVAKASGEAPAAAPPAPAAGEASPAPPADPAAEAAPAPAAPAEPKPVAPEASASTTTIQRRYNLYQLTILLSYIFIKSFAFFMFGLTHEGIVEYDYNNRQRLIDQKFRM